eukprot:4774975-Amphidinium_carterae.1
MSSESLELLRQQGFPLNSTDFGFVANSVATHGRGNHSEGEGMEPPIPYSLSDRIGWGQPDPE